MVDSGKRRFATPSKVTRAGPFSRAAQELHCLRCAQRVPRQLEDDGPETLLDEEIRPGIANDEHPKGGRRITCERDQGRSTDSRSDTRITV